MRSHILDSCKWSGVTHIRAGAIICYSPSMQTIATVQRCGTPDHLPPLSCYRIALRDGSKGRPKSDSQDSLQSGEDPSLLCRVCSTPITKPEEALSKNGLHEHVFFNPTGITFELRCFGRAKGCSLQGEPTTAFTWFAGYSWQYAICSTCLTHLGWRFQSDNDCFWGLIKNRLVE